MFENVAHELGSLTLFLKRSVTAIIGLVMIYMCGIVSYDASHLGRMLSCVP